MNAIALAPATSLLVDFGHGGNSDAFTREGWRGGEPRHRWSVGARNVLVLPPLAGGRRLALTVECDPPHPPSVRQDLALEFNGVALGVLQPRRGVPQRFLLPDGLVNNAGDNTLVCLNPQFANPADAAKVALAWRRLEVAPDDSTLFDQPELLPELKDVAAIPLQAVLGLYQSLGQNCELGIFQRRYGAEPIGLLRFTSIFPDRLVHGLRAGFAGVEAADQLSLVAARPGGELMGRQASYGLSYHTFKLEGAVDVAAMKTKEAQRLGYLARLFVEQLENDEKIFVRRGDFEAEGEIRALHQLLRVYNPRARLLLVQEAAERAGRVERLAPDLYRAYLSSFADPADVPATIAYEDWLKICATLYLDQAALGRVAPA
ncbi:MAG: hypothetical protein KGM15_16025 [Pseudomonadota bacterium]|nr:hypothetical protein [Pseudomonadota bacterium]